MLLSPFSEIIFLMELILPKDDKYLIKDKEKVFFLTGIYIFGQGFFIWFLSLFFNPGNLLWATLAAFFVFLFSYLIYFSKWAISIQKSTSSPWMTLPYPLAIFLAMLLVPKIAIFILAIFFVMIFPIILEYDRKVVVPIFIGISLFFIATYLFLFDKQFSGLEHVLIFAWISFSYVFFTILEYFFSMEVYNQRSEIEQLRKLSENLEIERDKLSFVITTMTDAVIVLNPDKEIVVFNKAAEEITGLELSSVDGKDIDSAIRFRYHNSIYHFKDLLESDPMPQVITIVNKEKKEIEVEPLLKKVFLPDSVDVQYVLQLKNLSREKELEKMRLNFVTIAAHELRTPITYIKGYLSFLLETAQNKLNNEEKGFLERAFIGSNNLAYLTENLLTVSNIETKSVKLQKTEFDWNSLLQEMVEKYQPIGQWEEIKVKLKLSKKELPLIKADKTKMQGVLDNLLTNAIVFNKKGGTVVVSAEVVGKNIVTNVTDSGIGIPEEKLPELFTEFFRLSGPLIQASKGAGLGLFISKYIIESHGGKIWVESTLEKGSTFYFSLPV